MDNKKGRMRFMHFPDKTRFLLKPIDTIDKSNWNLNEKITQRLTVKQTIVYHWYSG